MKPVPPLQWIPFPPVPPPLVIFPLHPFDIVFVVTEGNVEDVLLFLFVAIVPLPAVGDGGLGFPPGPQPPAPVT